jgi:hypothetical protein
MTESNTMFCGCYKSKSSAARAMRSWVGDQISVSASWESVSKRFETTIILRDDMMAVTRLQGGWGVSIRYTLADILCVVKGDDGCPKDVPYSEVAHWTDACTPLCKTPRGVFPYRFDSLNEAQEAGFTLWFIERSLGFAVVTDNTSAYAVRLPKAA